MPELAQVYGRDFKFLGNNQADVLVKKNDYKPFHIGICLVTNKEYKKFIDATDNPSPLSWEDRYYPEGKGDHPVHSISLEDAKAYCRWLSSFVVGTYRLPTELEWERASRGTDGRKYPWGDTFNNNLRCNFKGFEFFSDTSPVTYFSDGRSPCGCFDMVGNVTEFTEAIDISGYELFVVRSSDYKAEEQNSNCLNRRPFGRGHPTWDERSRTYVDIHICTRMEGVGFRVVWEAR